MDVMQETRPPHTVRTAAPAVMTLLVLSSAGSSAQEPAVDGMHAEVMEASYPSAAECGECHPTHYQQWSVSPHAYAQLSPVFNSMQATITKLTNGTNGDFCIRCHTPIGMSRGEPIFTSNMNRSEVSREGITCAVCHRVNEAYGKFSARIAIDEGGIYAPVAGPTGPEELERAKQDPAFNLATEDERTRRRAVHLEVEPFFELAESGFCGMCHDVNSTGGFRLEEAFSEYKSSPASARGVSCQDCHMGVTPGEFTGDPATNYARGPAAEIRGAETRTRKLTDHRFAGPDHSIIHPGVFPHNPEAKEFATIAEWLQFDWEAGWGTDEFEDDLPDDYYFPDRWADYTDRLDARFIIEDQLGRLDAYMEQRRVVLANGYQIEGIVTEEAGEDGFDFRVKVINATDGHSVPTGFIAERLVYLQVTVLDAVGDTVFKSGDLDPNGDVRDSHSVYVHNGLLPKDPNLLSLQSKFITRNLRGTEREQVLAVNHSLDPLPFERPSTISSVLTGRQPGARTHRMNIEPGGHRWGTYEVDRDALTGHGPYRATVRLLAAMVPVNLVHAISGVGFDYGMSAREVADAITERHALLAEYGAVLDPRRNDVEWIEREIPPARWHRQAPPPMPAEESSH